MSVNTEKAKILLSLSANSETELLNPVNNKPLTSRTFFIASEFENLRTILRFEFNGFLLGNESI